MKNPREKGQGCGEVERAVSRQATGKPRSRYSFTGGVRGKYAARYAEGSNVVVLDPDVADVFRTSEEVNRVLRAHMKEAR